LDALRDAFGGRAFTAKDVLAKAQDGFMQNALEVALRDLAGDRPLSSARSLGRVLKFREGRIVHGLRLTGRQNTSSGSREYRCETVQDAKPENPGFNGFTGSFSSHTEKMEPPFLYRGGETKPLNPSNPEIDPTASAAPTSPERDF
ncbi:MAG: hypothetical protein N4A39_11910, partial [Roseicyclus sp.]|nr:hypothetical protein [Roseicyclus sp.]